MPTAHPKEESVVREQQVSGGRTFPCVGLLSILILTHMAVVSSAGIPLTAGTLSRSSRTGLSLDPDALQHLRSPYNVYIKGLPASATDDQLRAWASGIAEPLSIRTIRELRNESSAPASVRSSSFGCSYHQAPTNRTTHLPFDRLRQVCQP